MTHKCSGDAFLFTLPAWKHHADCPFVQASFDLHALLRWRDVLRFDGPVLAGILVVASVGMATTLGDAASKMDVPISLLQRLETNLGQPPLAHAQ